MTAQQPPTRAPRIPPDVVDPPTQRLYAVSAFLLVQAFKLADLLFPSTEPPPLLSDDLVSFNSRLAKWAAIDCLALAVVAWLRIPRLDWGWKARWLARVALVGLDWLLFGRWTFSAASFLPSFIKAVVVSYLSTAERSVRLSSVVGKENLHLGGQYTVHILAVATAILNPLSASYCRHPPSTSKSDPTLIPLIFNNTSPSKLTYTLTSLDDPSNSHQYTIPASSLVRPSRRHPHHQLESSASEDDDELALAAEWSLVPAASQSQQAVRHRLPSSPSRDPRDSSSPFDLSPSESLYYLPISAIGSVRLDSVLDTDGHSIKIRRKRAPGKIEGFEEAKILRCPRAGFDLEGGEREQHRCLIAEGVAESFPLVLTVSGVAPLKVRWHSREGDPEKGLRKDESLDGIVGSSSASINKMDELIRVPMNVSLTNPGRTTYRLDSVVDSFGNEVSYSATSAQHLLEGTVDSHSVVVHRPPEVVFVGECGRGEDVQLLHGRKKKLQIQLSAIDQELDDRHHQQLVLHGHGQKKKHEALGTVELKFTPEGEGKGWVREIEAMGAKVEMEVDKPGTYEIVGVRSKWCGGAVLVPNACTLVLQPLPTLSTSFSPIVDVCGSELGLISTLHLIGTPPFVVHYTLTRLSGPGSPRASRHTKRVLHSRDELRIEPGPGEWEYRFTRIEDRHYRDVAVPAQGEYARRQKVPEVAVAEWRNAERGKTVHSCEGESVQVEVELKGAAPWDLEYSVVGQPAQLLEGITKSPHTIEVDIPKQIAQQGGQFSLSLETVKDGNGCKRPLTASDLVVEVRRTKPTARFHGAEGARSIVLREGDTAKIPLRLTGEGPWEITYLPPSRSGTPLSPLQFRADHPNVDINVRGALPGTYKLVSVRDRFCPGDVFETEWDVKTLPRPTLSLAEDAGSLVRNGSIVRKGVCENAVDSVGVLFDGKAPFKATYTLTKGSHHGDSRTHSLQAIQPRADLTLFTASPGHHTYQFTGVGDSLYTMPDPAGLVPPKGGKPGLVRLEQDVFALPSATFSHGAKHGFCVHDELASRGSDDLILHLEGQPPFELELEVREDGHRSSKRFTVPTISSHTWAVTLPYSLHNPTPHSISLSRIVDAHGCESLFEPSVSSKTTAVIPVAETATIAPVLVQTDHCVGDFLDFVVMGAPPFTVKYEFEGKKHTVPLSGSKFQRLAAEPGTFRIVSVGHGEDQCRSSQVNLVKHIHPIPSAKVSTGDAVVVDIREGDQTEIVFSFEGTPPFSFTYSRRAPQDRSKDRKVLETHTVTGIEDHSYSIFTSQEGTYSVSYIADAFCSYPPASRSSAAMVEA
ncbi:hypothetical protein JCM1841_000288 [Sporobolomyces salmonicolor]